MTKKMTKLKIKSGDTVQVIAGDHKGTEGKVLKVFIDKNKAIVEGVNMVKKHTKPTEMIAINERIICHLSSSRCSRNDMLS